MARNTMEQEQRGLRRRVVTLGLGLTPGDITRETGLHPVTVSGVLRGRNRLRPEHAARVGRLAAKRVRALFAR